MTCIVGYIDKANRKIGIGGDSAGVGGLAVRSRKDTKVFKNGPMIIGYTSSFRMGQLLRFKLEIPVDTYKDTYAYMCTDFIDSVRKCLKDNGYTKVENNTERIGCFIVAYKGRLFNIDDDLQVAENNYPYDATGCGENYALGSIRTLDNYAPVIFPIDFILKTSLEVATEFSGGVRPPYNIIVEDY